MGAQIVKCVIVITRGGNGAWKFYFFHGIKCSEVGDLSTQSLNRAESTYHP